MFIVSLVLWRGMLEEKKGGEIFIESFRERIVVFGKKVLFVGDIGMSFTDGRFFFFCVCLMNVLLYNVGGGKTGWRFGGCVSGTKRSIVVYGLLRE